ncbi:partial Endo-1,3-1,4-beta-glycanase ExsH, partial [uncultured bacterium]
TGNEGFNRLFGNSSNNRLDGGAGADYMDGGAGNDIYVIDNTGDVIVETGLSTGDGIESSFSYTLGIYFYSLTLTGTDNLNAIGNGRNNLIQGNEGNNFIAGAAGADTMKGLGGDDIYSVDSFNDVVQELSNSGIDTVRSWVNYSLSDHVENLILLGTVQTGNGNAFANTLTGNASDNILDGKGGVDTLIGGLGNDIYTVDNTNDVITEKVNEGWDVVYSSVDYTLGANVDALRMTGNAISGTGNADVNRLFGNTANNTLTGGNGADSLYGGLGQDTYNLNETIAATDTIIISSGESLTASFDIANNFKLGSGTLNTAGGDKLDLPTALIAGNINNANGFDVGTVHSHSINKGIISFDTAITSGNLADALGYLQANIAGNNTVAFVSEGNTYVFQDGVASDTLIELVGVAASSVNNTGLAVGAVWVV